MSLSSDAQRALTHLQSEFDANAAIYPDLAHIIIETLDAEAYAEANMMAASVFQRNHREVRRLFKTYSEIQIFIDSDFHRGNEAYGALCRLAEQAVETLAGSGVLTGVESPPDPSQPFAFEAKKNYYAGEWMIFVHRQARARPGSLPRSASTPFLEHQPLHKGGKAYTLSPGVFKASSLVLARFVADGFDQAPQALSPPAVSTASRRVPSLEQVVDIHQALWVFLLWHDYPSAVMHRREIEYLPFFVALADALESVRTDIDQVEGWPPRVGSALRVVLDHFDATTRQWGWERVAAPEPEREAFLQERRAWSRENLCRPMYEAALSWQAGFQGINRPADVDNAADKGRHLGFDATMTPVEGQAQYGAALKRWSEAPRIGKSYPRILDEQKATLDAAFHQIRAVVQPLAPDRTALPPWRHHSPAPLATDALSAAGVADESGSIISHVVIVVHGIRDHAAWQQMVREEIQSTHTIVIPVKYGYFSAIRFLFPFATKQGPQRRVERELMAVVRAYTSARISVICHSFGTDIVTSLLKDNPETFRIWRMILCGSVLRQDFRWDSIAHQIGEPGKPMRHFIVNDCGSADPWPLLAKSASWGFGAAGTDGFGAAHIQDRFHEGGHGLFMTREFVRQFWKPFLSEGRYVETRSVMPRSGVPRLVQLVALLPLNLFIAALVIIGFAGMVLLCRHLLAGL